MSLRQRLLSLPLHPRPPRLTTIVLALLLAAGCGGPGSGGTGDGEGQSVVRANVCEGPLAGALTCSTAAFPTSSSGTPMVLFADTSAGGNVAVRFQGNQIELAARCQGLRFDGEWGIAAVNDARFFGTYTAPGSSQPVPGSLTVQTAGGASSGAQSDLFALLRDINGRVVLGPVLLQRVAAPVANPAACPS